MSYQYRGADSEAHTRAKFEFYRKAEATIDAGPARAEYRPAPIRERKEAAECGSPAGYNAHILNKTPTCRACRDARAHYQREYRARRKCNA